MNRSGCALQILALAALFLVRQVFSGAARARFGGFLFVIIGVGFLMHALKPHEEIQNTVEGGLSPGALSLLLGLGLLGYGGWLLITGDWDTLQRHLPWF